MGSDELGGDDAKQFAASMQEAGGNGFPKSNALATEEVIKASADNDDHSDAALDNSLKAADSVNDISSQSTEPSPKDELNAPDPASDIDFGAQMDEREQNTDLGDLDFASMANELDGGSAPADGLGAAQDMSGMGDVFGDVEAAAPATDDAFADAHQTE